MVERDSFSPQSQLVHEDCIAVCELWSPLYFGAQPNFEEATKKLTKDEAFEEGILKLRRGAQYYPTDEDLLAGKYSNNAIQHKIQSAVLGEADNCLHLSDIYQRYGQSCFDPKIQDVAVKTNSLQQLKTEIPSVANELQVSDEVQMREVYYRSLKVYQHKFFKNGESDPDATTTLTAFESVIHEFQSTASFQNHPFEEKRNKENTAAEAIRSFSSKLLRDLHKHGVVENRDIAWKDALIQRSEALEAIKPPDSSKPLYFPLKQLKSPGPYPNGVDASRREEFLSPAEFQQVFNMTKDQFQALAKWKQQQFKKQHGLF
jgi:hypothetical protein